MLIDMHMHAFPDDLAKKALAGLKQTVHLEPACDGTVSGTVACMQRDHVDLGVLQCIQMKPESRGVNQWAAEVNGKNGLLAFGGMHYADPDLEGTLAFFKAKGIRGVKIHPSYQTFFLDDKRAFPLFDLLVQANMPLMIHAGYDPYTPKTIYALPKAALAVRKNFPHLTMILAHLGGMQIWNDVETQLAGKDFLFDTALIARYLPKEKAACIIQKHGAEQVLFGSDFPWDTSANERDFIDSLPLSDREKELIFSANAKRLLRLP